MKKELIVVRTIDIALLAIILPLVYFTMSSGFILIACIMAFVIAELVIVYIRSRRSFLDKVNDSRSFLDKVNDSKI